MLLCEKSGQVLVNQPVPLIHTCTNLDRCGVPTTITHCTNSVRTAITPSNSAITGKTPHLVLESRLLSNVVEWIGIDRRHGIQTVTTMEELYSEGLGRTGIQLGEVPSPSLDSLYPPSVSILPSNNRRYCVSSTSRVFHLSSHPLSIHQEVIVLKQQTLRS